MATAGQPEARWRPARLISGYGIKGEIEQEQRATSALLAVMGAVPDFGRVIVGRLGAPAGAVSPFTEIRFDDDGEQDAGRVPDGALVVQRGKTRWSCLVEVKTGASALVKEQVEAYLRIARAHAVDGLLTISNDIVSDAGELPIVVDRKLLKGVTGKHLSWWQILTMAIEQKEHRGISDPDQAWILGELISYLQDDRSGASGFAGMGEHWVKVREGARTLTLRPSDPAVADVAGRWEQFVEFLCLDLRQSLGRPVSALWPRNTALTRVNWLLRQAKDMPAGLRIEVRYPNVREPVAVLLEEARKHPERLLYAADPKREPRAFRLALTDELGLKRDAGQGSFLSASRDQVKAFYRGVLQPIRPWQATAPRLPAPTTRDDSLSTVDRAAEPDEAIVTTTELADPGTTTS